VYTAAEVTERKNFPIPLWKKPRTDILLKRIRWARREAERGENTELGERRGGNEWLFPTTYNTTRKEPLGVQRWIEEKFKLKRRAWLSNQRAYQIVRMLGERVGEAHSEHIWNHWWRSQRASQQDEEYEFEDTHLNTFFGWVDQEARRQGSMHVQGSGASGGGCVRGEGQLRKT